MCIDYWKKVEHKMCIDLETKRQLEESLYKNHIELRTIKLVIEATLKKMKLLEHMIVEDRKIEHPDLDRLNTDIVELILSYTPFIAELNKRTCNLHNNVLLLTRSDGK